MKNGTADCRRNAIVKKEQREQQMLGDIDDRLDELARRYEKGEPLFQPQDVGFDEDYNR